MRHPTLGRLEANENASAMRRNVWQRLRDTEALTPGVFDGDAPGLASGQVHVVAARASDGDRVQRGAADQHAVGGPGVGANVDDQSGSPMRSIRVASWLPRPRASSSRSRS